MKKIYLFLVPLYVLLNSCQKSSPVFDLAIHNINIIDLETGAILPEHSVFIKNDTIYSVAMTSSILTSSAIEVIDGSGQYLVPGFWDNHVHFRGGDSLIEENKKFLDLYIANGITTVRDAGGDLTGTIQQWQKEIAAGTRTGPDIYTSGPKIDGPNARWPGSLEVATEEDINNALDSLQKLNVDFVKLYESTIGGELYLKTIAETEKRGMISSGHMPFSVTLRETTEAGIDGIEHLYYVLKGCSKEEAGITEAVKKGEMGFWGSLSRVMETYSDTAAQSAFENLRSEHVFVVPTLHIGHTLSYLDEKDHTTDAYLNLMGKGIQKTYEGRIVSALNAPEEFVKMRKLLDSAFVNLTGKLSEAGVGLLAGSDSGAYNSYIYPGISLHQELEAMVNAGLSPLQALQASSVNGALFLNKKSPLIRTGAKANFVILKKNPLKDIKNTKGINWVIKSGRAYNEEDLKALLN